VLGSYFTLCYRKQAGPTKHDLTLLYGDPSDSSVIVEVATPSICTKRSLHRGVMVMVHRRLPHPVRSRRSRGSYVDMSIFPRIFGTLCLLVRFAIASVAICHLRYPGNINEVIALSFVKGLLRYNYETRSTIAMALQSPWITCDLDDLEKAYRERVSLT